MNKNVFNKVVLCALLTITSLCGCASNKYACKGFPEGVTCADPAVVYRLTEDVDHVGGLNLEDPEVRSKLEEGAGMSDGDGKKEVIEGVLRPPVDMTKPVLEPAQVMRIWIAPWVDDSYDLHGPSYVFTEVTPRRWSFGSYGVVVPQATYPFQLRPSRTTNAQGGERGSRSGKQVVSGESGSFEQSPDTK